MRIIDDYYLNAASSAQGKTNAIMTSEYIEAAKRNYKVFDVTDIQEYLNSIERTSNDIPCTPPFYYTAITYRNEGLSDIFLVENNHDKNHELNIYLLNKKTEWQYWGCIILQFNEDWTPTYKGSTVWIPQEFKDHENLITDALVKVGVLTMRILQLLNCKNISTIEHDGMEHLKPRVREHLIKSGKPLPIKHYTIAVTVPGEKRAIPFSQLIENEQHESKQALHVCRGHFATYTEDRKLFGKLTGTFWIPAHFKGLPKNGVITKDYQLKTR